ncbi:DUF4349 domain-containing protein [Paenibacillus aestuarii]|uniref:DUF4349 domain-containing protein n=1 Tax=Paenibacillus aestuarii TaxID=516965 RepID=A0ABW0KA02_9BACL|nr:DUF4349 domain-containing protein [Paenibacillus aestuarii]
MCNTSKLLHMIMLSLLLLSALAGCSSAKSESSAKSAAPEAQAASQPASMANAAQDQAAVAPGTAATGTAAGSSRVANDSAQAKIDAAPAPITVMPATGNDAAAGFNRKLIYRANLVMPVEDYSKAQTQLRDLVALSGGYILQFSENASTGERGGTYTIKVAASGFVSLLDGLEKISPTLQRNVQGQDVTEEYVDLESRLKAKQLVESRLLSFMEKAAKTDDLLAFSNELSKVQENIEQIKGRMRYLDQNVAYSTIELRMYQQTANKPLLADPNVLSLQERIERAWYSSLNVLTAVLQGILVFFAAALPVLAVLAIIAIPIWVYRRKKHQQLLSMREHLKMQNADLQTLEVENQGTKDGL